MPIHAPNLKVIDQNLEAMGNKDFENGFPFPSLETIGGDMNIAYTGLPMFPKSIKKVGGNVVISDQEPYSLVVELKAAKREGIIHGNIFCIITP